MATTILGHIKENKEAHLKRSIAYIMNPAKTENGLWVGSNCGTDAGEIYDSMMATKETFDKTKGRQGYHFVLSFTPGETNEKTAYEIAEEFCREYFNNSTDYVFAVHNDHAHIHAHIVFNSVNRISGYKYRYENGDWEKYIQPITDRIARAHGLSELQYERLDRKGKSYAEVFADKADHITQRKILKADMDFAISQSKSIEEFFDKMREMGYRLRFGESVNHGRYVSYTPPNYIRDGKKKGFRDYTKGMAGYSIREIEKVFAKEKVHVPIAIKLTVVFQRNNTFGIQRNYVERVTQAVLRHSYYPEDIDQAQVRKDLLQIHKLEEECDYLIKNGITDLEAVEARLSEVKAEERKETEATEGLAGLEKLDDGFRDAKKRLQDLDHQVNRATDLSDEEYETLSDEMEQIIDQYPMLLYETEKKACIKSSLQALRAEKSILRRIIKNADVTLNIRYREPARNLSEKMVITKEGETIHV